MGIRERLTHANLMPMAKSKDERWLSVAEAARTLRVSRAAVYKAIAQGRLKSREMVLPRRALRINVEDVKKFRVSKSRQHRGEGRKRRSRQ
jgi:excisionase family DNA binding protein